MSTFLQTLKEKTASVSLGSYVLGMIVIGVVCLTRSLGLLQGFEWWAFDTFLRLRPAASIDERVVVIAIEEEDFQRYGNSIPDRALAELLQTLGQYQPRAIGMDLFRDSPVEPGYQQLVEAFEQVPNIFGINGIGSAAVNPPPELSVEQVGFATIPQDKDGFTRRLLLTWIDDEASKLEVSLSLRLAIAYLEAENIDTEVSSGDSLNIRIGDAKLTRLQSNSGAYVNVENGGHRVLLNPQTGRPPFRRLSMQAVLAEEFDPDWIRDRVVLIGVIAPSVQDLFPTAAVTTDLPGFMYGVEMHAHGVSQLLDRALKNRPPIRVWPEVLEYGWILVWGGLGVWLVHHLASPRRYVLAIIVLGSALILGSFSLLWLWSWWIPVVPPLIVFGINGLVLSGFYLYDQTMRARIDERQQVIQEAYTTIHNGPLQELAVLSKLAGSGCSLEQVFPKIQQIEQDLRALDSRLEILHKVHTPATFVIGDTNLNLEDPLNEVLFGVYNQTLTRDFPGFQSLKLKMPSFDPLDTAGLSHKDRRDLCQFLEEALCNVGKHAKAPTRLSVVCKSTEQINLIRIEDNGHSMPQSFTTPSKSSFFLQKSGSGWGTQQSLKLAKRLNGQFQRGALPTRGTYCELCWPRSDQSAQVKH
ncbi:sensor histidine kinase [Leptothoe sp. PORK10 BA2]|uniref:sensor histidine kinase n=1 Tax=Leptothoe sp. PORK10 BA2 TaxID=3110254 RepID=UPI002B21F850|nr:CHASE2 domain-containing protein [Leptothoe sp. PORK10 BA2]MEA5467158.1 CHASE2 domain-containing protein [Leptothoe sp. PORK10 BA2]